MLRAGLSGLRIARDVDASICRSDTALLSQHAKVAIPHRFPACHCCYARLRPQTKRLPSMTLPFARRNFSCLLSLASEFHCLASRERILCPVSLR